MILKAKGFIFAFLFTCLAGTSSAQQVSVSGNNHQMTGMNIQIASLQTQVDTLTNVIHDLLNEVEDLKSSQPSSTSETTHEDGSNSPSDSDCGDIKNGETSTQSCQPGQTGEETFYCSNGKLTIAHSSCETVQTPEPTLCQNADEKEPLWFSAPTPQRAVDKCNAAYGQDPYCQAGLCSQAPSTTLGGGPCYIGAHSDTAQYTRCSSGQM